MKKNILLLIIGILILGFLVFYFLKPSETTDSIEIETKTTESKVAKEILLSLQKMSKVKLDDSIFYDSFFKSLKDNSIEISPQESYRDNPFSPINAVGVGIAPQVR